MGRIKKGWQLTKKAWGVVRENPGLAKLPIMGGILAAISFIVLGLPGVAIIAATENGSSATAGYIGGGLLVAIGGYLASYFVIYYNVALAAAADMAFRGEAVDNKAGVAVARQRRGVIAQWALVAVIVSMIFNLIRDRGGIAGQVAAGLGAAIWGLITFLIAPVLAFEGLGPAAAIKRSAAMFKDKWGQQIVGNLAIGVITGIATVLAVLVAAAGVFVIASGNSAAIVAGGGLLIVGIAGVIAAAVVSGAVRGVFGVALYRYIAEGQVVGPFTAAEFEDSVRPGKGKNMRNLGL